MAKILVTGFTGSQCKRQYADGSQLKVTSSHYSLVNCLKGMGHVVEQRPVTLGEHLTSYDEVIVYLWTPRALVATQTFGALYAISQHPKCILAFNDWQMLDQYKGIEKVVRERNLFHPFIIRQAKLTIGDVEPYDKHFEQALDTIIKKQNRLLLPTYSAAHLNDDSYGIHLVTDKISYPLRRVFTYNPNPYNRNRTFEDPGHYGPENPDWIPKHAGSETTKRKADFLLNQTYPTTSKKSRKTATSQDFSVQPQPSTPTSRPPKLRQFNFASLVQSKSQPWLKKQGLKTTNSASFIGTWPVHLYGSRSKSQTRLPEDQMVRQITRDWGCLLPAYGHAGSGWWRKKVLQCADAGSVLIGDEKELRVYYGDEYRFYELTAEKVTEMSEGELKDVARCQKECLYRLHDSTKKAGQEKEVRRVLEAEV